MKTIQLAGELGSKFGRLHRAVLDTNTPAEAVRYLCSQFPGAAAYLYGAERHGIRFAVFRGKENLKVDQLHEPVGNDVIRIVPIITGSKSGGVVSVIVGAVLVIVGAIGAYTPFGQAYGGAAWGPYLMTAGWAMVAGGIVQLLTPLPKGGKGKDSPANEPSYVFSGSVNTQAQGNPVPLLYGRMIVGSAVISAGINAEDYSPVSSGVGPGTPGHNPKTPYDEVLA
ncbi:tail assembly protein [Frateuria terrea]|nr:tail assembly protein [Frateuria terrea]